MQQSYTDMRLIGIKVEDVPQLPVAADHGGGQAGAVGQGDAHPFQVNTDQLLRAHLLGQCGEIGRAHV